MARAISDEVLQLKRRARRRLIGAIVLVTVIIVVLPMVLDSEPKPVSRDISVQIPSPDAGMFTSKVAPLPAPKTATGPSKAAAESKAATRPVEAQKPAAAPPVVPPSPEPVTAVPKETAKETPKPAKAAPAKSTKAPKPAAKPAGGQFAVQVIALADAEKAKQMQAKIAASGIKAYTEIVKTAKGDVTRVRAGPFATREAAEKARLQLKAIGMNGNVTTQ